MTEPLRWTQMSPSTMNDESTQGALEELERVFVQYERYVTIARINDLPTPTELADPNPNEVFDGARPLGLVMDTATPIGFHLSKRP